MTVMLSFSILRSLTLSACIIDFILFLWKLSTILNLTIAFYNTSQGPVFSVVTWLQVTGYNTSLMFASYYPNQIFILQLTKYISRLLFKEKHNYIMTIMPLHWMESNCEFGFGWFDQPMTQNKWNDNLLINSKHLQYISFVL